MRKIHYMGRLFWGGGAFWQNMGRGDFGKPSLFLGFLIEKVNSKVFLHHKFPKRRIFSQSVPIKQGTFWTQ